MVEVAEAQRRSIKADEEGEAAILEAERVRDTELNDMMAIMKTREEDIREKARQAINIVKSSRGTAAAELAKVSEKYNQSVNRLLGMFPDYDTSKKEIEDVRQAAQATPAS